MAPHRPDNFGGMSIADPPNRIAPGHVALAVNVRSYGSGQFNLRNSLTDPILTLDAPVQSIARLNDTTPAGLVVSPSGFILLGATTSGNISANAVSVSSGHTGNPVSMVPFRPNTSVQPWMYIGDDAPYPNVIVDGGFNCAGMIKVRSDGLSRKVGIAEPQIAPTVSFPGGGTGPSLIFYRYVYRASETGALSNPSPDAIPGTNSQSNPSLTVGSPFSPTQVSPAMPSTSYEVVSPFTQIRTKGSVPPGTVTEYVIPHNFGFAIPAGVTIDGITCTLNWIGQNSGTGVLSSAALFYLGTPFGTPKLPGIANVGPPGISTVLGDNSDTWGATLTPAIINDPSFGFGVQITTQSAGGSDRSFLDYFIMTVYYSTQDAVITPSPSLDPQVDKIDIYRQGGGLASFTYVGTTPNSTTPFTDLLSDLVVAGNPQLEFDNFEPFPSIDLPQAGTLNAAGNVLTWVSGGDVPGPATGFKIRWLPGTIILIGSPTQVAYTAVRRPSSTTVWDFNQNDPNVPPIPDGTNLPYNIAEPDLAAQPLAYLFGPTDNINYEYGVGDPYRPGTIYWCKGSNLDSAPDTNQQDLTDPSEVLVNGAMSGGLGVVFSIKRAWIILPNYFNALATVTGTEGSTWTFQATGITRGLFIPRCLCVSGGGMIFFRVDDGVHMSRGGSSSVSITDSDLFPLFPHESPGTGLTAPQPVTRNGVTIYPPDDSLPELQKFSSVGNWFYYDYRGTDGLDHTLVFDMTGGGWVWDLYSTVVTIHATNEGESQQGTLVGCADGTIRLMSPNGTEIPNGIVLTAAIGGMGWVFAYEYTVEYQSNATVLLTSIAADVNNGSYAPNAVTLPSTGGQIMKYTFKVSKNKWRLMWMQFASTDNTMKIFLEGFVLNCKPWGDAGPFKPISPFKASGGHGGQP